MAAIRYILLKPAPTARRKRERQPCGKAAGTQMRQQSEQLDPLLRSRHWRACFRPILLYMRGQEDNLGCANSMRRLK
jgi:hypothetical protein